MFLASLIDRALDGRTTIAPRRASRYEIDANMAEPSWREAEIQDEAAPQTVTDRSITVEPVRGAAALSAIEGQQTARAVQPPATVAVPPETSTPARGKPTPIITRLEQLAPRVEPTAQAAPAIRPAPAPAAAPTDAPPPAIRELHTHERIEVRHEPREIERRLETLTREHLIERIARAEATPAAPPATSVSQAAAPPPAADPLRPRIARAQQVAPPSRRDALPNVLATPPEPPARTVVHVSIGRVEVRNTAPPPAGRTATRARAPRTGLDDYLRRREQA